MTLMRTVVLLLALLLSGCDTRPPLDYSLSLLNAEEGEAGEAVVTTALSSDGTFAAVATIDGTVSVWDITQRKEIKTWPKEEFGGGAQFLKFTAGDEKLLLAGVDHSVQDSTGRRSAINYFMILDIADNTSKRIWTIEGARLTAVSPSEDGSKVLTGFSNGLMVLFNSITSTRQNYSLHTDKLTDLKLSPDGKFALSGSIDTTSIYWEVATGDVLHRFAHKNRASTVAVDSNFSRGFTSDTLDNQRLWDLGSGKLVASLKSSERWMSISSAHFSADRKRLLLASPSGMISIWDSNSGEKIAQWRTDFPVIDVAENNSGNIVSIGSTGIVDIWERQW